MCVCVRGRERENRKLPVSAVGSKGKEMEGGTLWREEKDEQKERKKILEKHWKKRN